ncbi:MAG: hypothetical protein ACI9OJ_004163 [Myxococcota bacterium]|jgi:hypothetical protein
MAEHPTHPGHLLGTKWTSAKGLHPFRHWEVMKVVRDQVHLQATLDSRVVMISAWRSLRTRAEWQPGWLSTADEPADSVVK